MRKPIQIATLPEGESNYPAIFVLFDDGTILAGRSVDVEWRRVDLPEDVESLELWGAK